MLFTCSICDSCDARGLQCCPSGCGTIAHTKCAFNSDDPEKPFSCPVCLAKPVAGAHSNLLKRIADMMNLTFNQGQTLSDMQEVLSTQNEELVIIKAELQSCKAELSATRMELKKLQMASASPKRFESAATQSSASSSHKLPSADNASTLSVPVAGGLQERRSRSPSKRPRLDRDALHSPVRSLPPVTIGTGLSSTIGVPVVKKIVKKRVFVSRIAPNFSAEALYNCLSSRISASLSVVQLKTLHDSYSSFCLYVDENDEKILLSADFWAEGTVIKSFYGRISEDRIVSRYDGKNINPTITVTSPLTAPLIAPNGMPESENGGSSQERLSMDTTS